MKLRWMNANSEHLDSSACVLHLPRMRQRSALFAAQCAVSRMRPRDKTSEKLARHERFDTVCSLDCDGVCHFDVAHGARGPLSCKIATRILNPDTIAICTGGAPPPRGVAPRKGEIREIESTFLPADGFIIDADATMIIFPLPAIRFSFLSLSLSLILLHTTIAAALI